MRVLLQNAGYDRWADIEDVTMLVRPDGTVVTSLPDPYCNERLLTPKRWIRRSNFFTAPALSRFPTPPAAP